ncbi:MAG: iron-containing redox enzyme family protein [Actinomycetota bacterium]|nr:iron-containing redox enzyme family protein [Actinomycetota bacterium]
MTVLSSDQLLAEIDRIIAERHIKDHPMVTDIRNGTATRDAIAGFLRNFYHIAPKPSPQADCAIYAKCPPDPDIHHLLFEEIIMEEGAGTSSDTDRHLKIYFSHAAAFGLSESDLENTLVIPECLAFIHWRYYLAFKGDWLGAMAGSYFIEGASAERNDIILQGLVEHYGFLPGSDDLLFWELHASEVEEEHGDIGPLVAKYATDEFIQQGVLSALRTGIDLQRLAFDGMYRAFFTDDPTYERWR